MFTGIIEEVGTVAAIDRFASGARIEIACARVLEDATPGASIAVNGTCLTAVALRENSFQAELSPETLARTNVGFLQPGSLVNLERPLRFNGRLDGHFVLGHVDGAGRIVCLRAIGDGNWWLRVELPHELAKYVVDKASLAIDGISLTVAAIEGDLAGFAVIPHTYGHTNLKSHSPGDPVNIEVDILAKHLEKLISAAAPRKSN